MKKRILVIDDERPFADSLVEYFVDRGYEARAVYDAEGGLAVLEAYDPHAIVTDLRLPGESGLDLLARIRTAGDRRVVVLVSAHGDLPAVWKTAHFHGDGFLRKPLSIESLGRVIEEAFARRAAEVERST